MILVKVRMLVRGERPPIWVGIIAGVIYAALLLVFFLLFDYFGVPRSLHEPYGVFVLIAISACAAFIASFISRRIVEWKNGPPAESLNS